MALVKCHGANKLDIEVTHAHGALGSLSHGGKGLGKHVVERLAIGIALTELIGLAAELLLRQLFILGLERVDLIDELLVTLKIFVGSKGQQL